MADGIRVNGNQFSWGSIICKVDGEKITGFTAIAFADKRERVVTHGMGRHQAPRARSRGKYTVEPVKLTGYTGSVDELRARLADRSPDGRSYGDVEFEIVVQHVESRDSSEDPITIEIERCVWTGNSASLEEGSESTKEEIEISAMLIRRNGLTLFDSSQGSP